MAIMEGPLSKWTNVMKGWQYRWFVLDENSGLLSYYTSKEKMMRGARRGCVRLKGAVIGIDDEDDSTFTITVDQKTFHFQARDADEKERWISALQATIERHSQPSAKWEVRALPSLNDFDKKLAESDAYLQILIDQVQALEARIEDCPDEDSKDKYNGIKHTAEAMIESIKQGIVLLQISKSEFLEESCFVRPPISVPDKTQPQNACSDSPLINGSAFDAMDNVGLDVPSQDSLTVHHVAQPLSKSSVELPVVDVALPNGVTQQGVVTSTSMPNLSSPSAPAPSSPTTSVASSVDSGTQPMPGPAQGLPAPPTSNSHVPAVSYSSSEDEDFFDAEDDMAGTGKNNANDEERPPLQVIASKHDEFDELYDDINEDDTSIDSLPCQRLTPMVLRKRISYVPRNDLSLLVEQQLIFILTVESLDKHGSVITHLLSQVRIGMDLTKIVLPTFILEKRSLLEMYADFLAHPDLFVGIVDQQTPQERMVQVVRWYLSAFHAGRRSSTAKKPYNPILGETFRCVYELPDEEPTEELADDGPIRWATRNNVSFLAEQVSHHPPISAFYAEHYNKRISLDGYIWTKSKFLGLSIGVHMIGQAMITVADHNEEYMITFPNGYGRSILTVPWVELGGKVTITCAQTAYSATVDFHTKPFYGGKKDRVTAEIFAPNERKAFCSIEGEWNGVMYAKFVNGSDKEVFVDTKTMPIVKKRVKKLEAQEEFESRRLWKDVTYHLKNKNVEEATVGKRRLEQRQREEAKERKELGVKWETKLFHEVGEHWVYDSPLHKRLAAQAALEADRAQEEQERLQLQAAAMAAAAATLDEPPAAAAASDTHTPPATSGSNQSTPDSLPPPLVPTVVNSVAQPAS